MLRRSCVFLLALTLTLSWAAFSSAQVEKKVGLGVDVENQSFELISFSAVGSPFFTLAHTSLTPCFQMSFRVSPNVFIEPSFGWHKDKDEVTDTSANLTNTLTEQDVKIGLGVMFLTNPSQFVSPYFRGKVDIHFLNAKEEDDVTFPSVGTDELEISATAWVLAASMGGIVNIKEVVFVTAEGRLMYAKVGDVDEKASGPNFGGFTDTTDTSSSRLAIDMIIGLRVMIF